MSSGGADVKLTVGLQAAKPDLSDLKKDIENITKSLEKESIKVKVGVGLDIDKAALEGFRTKLESVIKGVTLSDGAPVKLKLEGIGEITSDMKELENQSKRTKKAVKDATSSKTSGSSSAKQEAKIKEDLIKQEQRRQALLRQTESLIQKIEIAEKKWTAARDGKSSASYRHLADYKRDAENLHKELRIGGNDIDSYAARFKSLSYSFTDAGNRIKAAGENTKTFGQHMRGLAQNFGSWLTVSQAIMFAVNAAKKMVSTVVELDSAMTELKKVTDASDATYDRFLDNAVDRAKSVGASVNDVITATADYARLGYSIDEASELADTSIVYKNVADGISDISTASESIISTMKAFGIEASDAMSIVDKFNNVSNNFAISSSGIGEAMQRSASAMKAAGNDIDETIALITAANTIVQDPQSVGTTMKTLSMYLRAAKTEAEEAGVSTDGMANSVSELRDEISSLTGGAVDIMLDDNTFKSTYDILKDIAGVWDSLSDVSRANILELIGGKRNSNVTSALLENFDLAEEVLAESQNSAGSALAENEKYLDSIAGKMDKFTASFESLSTTVVNSDFIAEMVDGGTVLLDILTGILDVTGLIGPALAGGGIAAFFKNLD